MKKDILDKIIILETYNHVIKHLDTLLEDDSSNELRGILLLLNQTEDKINREYTLKMVEINNTDNIPGKEHLVNKLFDWLKQEEDNLSRIKNSPEIRKYASNFLVTITINNRVNEIQSNISNKKLTTTDLLSKLKSPFTPGVPFSMELAKLKHKSMRLSAEYKTKRNSVVFSYDDPKRIVQLKELINWLEGVIHNLEREKPVYGDDQITQEYDFHISVFKNHLVEARREYTKTLDIQKLSTTSTTTPEPRSWIQNLGSNLKDFITNRTTIISLGVVLFSLIAYYFWKRYRRDRCEGLTGKVLKNCKLQAINQAILGVRSQIKNCKTQSDPKKCVQDAKKIMKEWEAKKRMI